MINNTLCTLIKEIESRKWYSSEKLRDVRRLIADIVNVEYIDILLNSDYIAISPKQKDEIFQAIDRLFGGEPVSKIINKKMFWKHNFFVNEHVLDPRHDSETIISAVLDNVSIDANLRILDLGTGSGCLIISLLDELKNSSGVGVDISQEALKVAQVNADRILQGTERLSLVKACWGENIQEKFDIIVSNPPYIKNADIETLDKSVKNFDPLLALDGGESGLESYFIIKSQLNNILKDDGLLFLEIGYNQARDIEKIFNVTTFYLDLEGKERVAFVEN